MEVRLRVHLLFIAFVGFILVAGLSYAPAAVEAEPSPLWTGLWLAEGGLVAENNLKATLDELGRQASNPKQIIVFLHGYDMSEKDGKRFFDKLAQSLSTNLDRDSSLYLGLQWDSGGALLGSDYFKMLERARDLGRAPLRQILIELKKRYPELPLVIFAHSMGCEMATAALVPEMAYLSQAPKAEVFALQQVIKVQMAVFAGSDLDYDIWQQNPKAGLNWFKRCDLTWVTVSDPTKRGDRVLSLRARIRGKAMGALMPQMTEEQMALSLGAGKLYIDSEDIPSDHEFDSYFSAKRIKRLAKVVSYLSAVKVNPALARPPELEAMGVVMRLPKSISALAPYLDSPYSGAALISLWRIELLECGSARHLADGSIEGAIRLLVDQPKLIWPLQKNSACRTLRLGLFPTPKTMARAGAPEWARPEKWRLDNK